MIMDASITIETLAKKVRVMRNLQNKFFRIPKDNKEERQLVLRASKACESEVDKMLAVVLDQDYDTAQ
jgi:hypothetical protein